MIFYDISNVERDNKIIDGIDGIDGIDEWEGRFVNDRMESGGHIQDKIYNQKNGDMISFIFVNYFFLQKVISYFVSIFF